AGGAGIDYIRDRLSEHATLFPLATPLMLDWLTDRIAGVPFTATGTRTIWSVAANPGHWRGLLSMADTAARILLGRPLRPRREPHLPDERRLAA
ncbi:MAG: lipase, partial [Nocardia sp.]|nr:lipase [Nocardia sp.]